MSATNKTVEFLDTAITGHVKWRTRFNDSAAGGEKIDPAVACRDDACPLGKWIHGDGKSFSGLAQFGDVQGKHREFHRCAGEIAGQIASGHIDEAKKSLSSDSSAFNRATAATVDAIKSLRSAIHDKENKAFRWRNFSIRNKLFIGFGSTMVLMLVILLATLFAEKGNMLEERRLKTRHLVEVAHTLIVHYHGQQLAGKLGEAEARNAALAALKQLRYQGQEYFWVNDMQHKVLMHPIRPELDGKDLSESKDPNGKKLFVEFVETVKRDKAGFVDYLWPKPGASEPVPKISYVKGFEPWGWVVGSGIYIDDVIAAFWKNAQIVLGIFLAVVALTLVLAVYLSRSLSRPAERMRDVMVKLADTGDLSMRVEAQGGDEIGQTMSAFNDMLDMLQTIVVEVNHVVNALANGAFSERILLNTHGDFKVMKDAVNRSATSTQASMEAIGCAMRALYNGDFSQRVNADVKGEFKIAIDQVTQAMQAMLGDVGDVMNRVVQGNLGQRVRAEGRGDLALLKENINASVEGLSLAMKAIGQNSQQVAAASNQTSNAISQISDGAQNQMHAINQVSSAVQQTASVVTEVARSTEAANARAQSMGKTVNEGIADMTHMVEIVQSIATNADRIDKITDVIEKIANKTNLLSLNAAIEAARAGEHGKGFAVVAEEVGKLAASAAESTQEIAVLVKQAVEDAERATGTVAVVNKGMQEISQGARQTEAELQRISAAMEQQNAAISEINTNVGSLNRIASANASAAEEITSTVIELARLADGTRREVERFGT